MEFNLRIKISEIFQSIITHSGFSINPKDYCLILEDKTSDTTTYLDFDKTLQVYEILDTHDVRSIIIHIQITFIFND